MQYDDTIIITYFIDRDTEYNQNGRIHTLEQAKEADQKLKDILEKHNIEYTSFTTEATEGSYELGGLYQDYYYRRYNKQDKDETVYAKFDIQGYTLTVNAKSNTGGATGTYQNNTTGGTVKINNNYATNISGNGTKTATAKIYFGKSASITATPATGYKFAGWYTNADLSGTAASTSATFTTASMTTSGLTYYAKFSVGSITITYNANAGTSGTVTSGTAYYNTAYTIPATAVWK